jgi:hypothetical protein
VLRQSFERSDEEFIPMANSADMLARGLRDNKKRRFGQ